MVCLCLKNKGSAVRFCLWPLMKTLINLLLNLIGLKVIKNKKYLKLINSEKNYIQNLKTSEEFKKLIKELVIKSENLQKIVTRK